MKKCVITVVGKDTVGIIAKVCEYLAGANVNILDISQTIVDGYFNMMMIVDVTNCSKEVAVVSKDWKRSELLLVLLFTAREKKYLKKCTDYK
jgi:ACT domain-containing protein